MNMETTHAPNTTLDLFEKVKSGVLEPEQANRELLDCYDVKLVKCQWCGSENLTTDGQYKWCKDCNYEQSEN